MYKQVIVVRTDLKMSRGKTAVQVAHASISVMDQISKKTADAWKKEGQKKIVLKVSSLDELLAIEKRCKKEKIPAAAIADAGLTELEPGTVTAVAIGPGKEERIDKITGHLKIL